MWVIYMNPNSFKLVLGLAALLFSHLVVPTSVSAAPRTVFRGTPQFAINEFGFMREAAPVDQAKASLVELVISEIDGKYYWASRENREVIKIEGGEPKGSIVTYVALDGSGYIRIVTSPQWKAKLRTRFPDYDLDYTEHLLQGLGSYTYFGIEKKR